MRLENVQNWPQNDQNWRKIDQNWPKNVENQANWPKNIQKVRKLLQNFYSGQSPWDLPLNPTVGPQTYWEAPSQLPTQFAPLVTMHLDLGQWLGQFPLCSERPQIFLCYFSVVVAKKQLQTENAKMGEKKNKDTFLSSTFKGVILLMSWDMDSSLLTICLPHMLRKLWQLVSTLHWGYSGVQTRGVVTLMGSGRLWSPLRGGTALEKS